MSKQHFMRLGLLTSIGTSLIAETHSQEKDQTPSSPTTAPLPTEPHPKNAAPPKTIAAEPTVDLNFKDATLASVFNYLADQKKIQYVPNNNLESQRITLSSPRPFTLTEAWYLLLTLLETKGFSLINVNGLYRIVASAQARTQPLPDFVGIQPEELPENNMVIRYVYIFQNVKENSLVSLADGLLSGKVIHLPTLNAWLITERSLIIKELMRIIKELDVGGLRESIKVVQLKHALASDVAAVLSNIIKPESTQQEQTLRFFARPSTESAYFSPTTRIFSYTPNNLLILVGTEANIQRIIDFIFDPKNPMDQPPDLENSVLRIKELKYTQAKDIYVILDSIIKAAQKGPRPYFADVVVADETIAEADTQKTKEGGAKGKEASPSVQPKHGNGNRLIIASNKEDWERLERFIDQLDKPEPQVALEVLFVDVEQERDRTLAASTQTKKNNLLGRRVNGLSLQGGSIALTVPDGGTVPTNPITPGSESERILEFATGPTAAKGTFITLGKDQSVWSLIQSLFSSSNTSILSQPYIVTRNNKSCSINLAPTQVTDADIDPKSTTAVKNLATVEAQTQISITPRINLAGSITLNLTVDLDEFLGGARVPIENRTIDTQATMNEGEVFVIGGLTQNKDTETASRVPILGSIPIIGTLFRGKSKVVSRHDLYIFIRPTIIKPRFDGKPEEYTNLKLDYARLSIKRSQALGASKDPIQRWFFDTSIQRSSKLKTLLENTADDIEQINDFVEGKNAPSSTSIELDPYYKASSSRTIARYKKRSRMLRQSRVAPKPIPQKLTDEAKQQQPL